MKRVVVVLSTLLSFGCSGRIINVSESPVSPLGDTGSEAIHVIVPEGSKVGYRASRPGLQIVEYVPESQSVDHWTDMLTVLIMARDAAPDIDTFFQRMTDRFQAGCDVEAEVEAPVKFLDGVYPAGTQTVICGKSKKFGSGSVVIYKMIQGLHGFYQVQRSWNLPPVARSEDNLLTKAMRDSAAARLALVHLCDRQNADQKC